MEDYITETNPIIEKIKDVCSKMWFLEYPPSIIAIALVDLINPDIKASSQRKKIFSMHYVRPANYVTGNRAHF